MMCTKSPIINYDNKFDVMYCNFGDTSHMYGDDELKDIIIMKDIDSDEVKGYTILGFKKMMEPGTELFNKLLSIIGKNVFDAMKMKCI